jgi:hypothetical protein
MLPREKNKIAQTVLPTDDLGDATITDRKLALQIAIVPPDSFLKAPVSELESIPTVDNQPNADRK